MFPYVITFFVPAFMAMLQSPHRPWKSFVLWIPVAVYLIIFIGFRHEIGSDWDNYLDMFIRDIPGMDYWDALVHGDPAFYLLMVWVYKMGWSIHMVNFVSSIAFVTGLIVFARRMPNPWLMLIVAIGYTILTSGMGYVRHGVAFGFSLWALVALMDKKFLKFFILIVVGATFHKSAVIMLGIGLFYGGKGKYLKIIAIILMGIGIYMGLISGREEHYIELYIEGDLHSSGAYIRTFMNAIPAFIFFYYRKKWKRFWPDGYVLWYMLALASLASIPAVMVVSTATDRISVYLIPLQFVVFSHLPLLWRASMSPRLTTGLVVSYYAAVYFVWLLFAVYAYAWVPYNNILPVWIEGLFDESSLYR